MVLWAWIRVDCGCAWLRAFVGSDFERVSVVVCVCSTRVDSTFTRYVTYKYKIDHSYAIGNRVRIFITLNYNVAKFNIAVSHERRAHLRVRWGDG